MITYVITTDDYTAWRSAHAPVPVEGEEAQPSECLAITRSVLTIGGAEVFECRPLPGHTIPESDILWRSDQVDAEEQPVPKPLFAVEVPVYDEQGTQTGTQIVQQTAPELA